MTRALPLTSDKGSDVPREWCRKPRISSAVTERFEFVASADANAWSNGATQPVASGDMVTLSKAIDNLLELSTSREVLPPRVSAVARAKRLVNAAWLLAEHEGIPWTTPSATASAFEEVVLEWWQGARKLTVYIPTNGQVRFVRVWGCDIDSDMMDGDVTDIKCLSGLLRWLQKM